MFEQKSFPPQQFSREKFDALEKVLSRMFSTLFSTFLIIYKGCNTGCWSKVIGTMIRIIKLRNFILFCSLSFFIFTVNSRFFLNIGLRYFPFDQWEHVYCNIVLFIIFIIFTKENINLLNTGSPSNGETNFVSLCVLAIQYILLLHIFFFFAIRCHFVNFCYYVY